LVGDWKNIVFLERLWKPVKYEQVYLHGRLISLLPRLEMAA
jgi:hypothetical protein